MEECNLQIRDPNDDNIRQWAAVRQPRFQGLLFKPRHQEPILLPRASLGEWTDGGDKSNT